MAASETEPLRDTPEPVYIQGMASKNLELDLQEDWDAIRPKAQACAAKPAEAQDLESYWAALKNQPEFVYYVEEGPDITFDIYKVNVTGQHKGEGGAEWWKGKFESLVWSSAPSFRRSWDMKEHQFGKTRCDPNFEKAVRILNQIRAEASKRLDARIQDTERQIEERIEALKAMHQVQEILLTKVVLSKPPHEVISLHGKEYDLGDGRLASIAYAELRDEAREKMRANKYKRKLWEETFESVGYVEADEGII